MLSSNFRQISDPSLFFKSPLHFIYTYKLGYSFYAGLIINFNFIKILQNTKPYEAMNFTLLKVVNDQICGRN
jgi:hypothetical protein